MKIGNLNLKTSKIALLEKILGKTAKKYYKFGDRFKG
jgi:hypothetical protein